MKKFVLKLGLLVLLFSWAVPARAADVSLHATAAVGYEDTMAYDLYLQVTFDPWAQSDGFALVPFLQAGMLFWYDDDARDYEEDSVWGGTAAFGLEMLFGSSEYWRFYIAGSFGPSLISEDDFANRRMGGAVQFRSRGELGFRFGEGLRHNIHLHASHYSNAGIYSDNEGYNAYGISYGYTF